MSDALAHLARLAGVVDHWIDTAGYRHRADGATVRSLLAALGIAADTPSQVRESKARMAERRRLPPRLLTTWLGMPTRLGFALPSPAGFRLAYEDGSVVEGQVFDADGARWLPPVLHSGYHQLDIAGLHVGLAVAPLQACSIADLGPSRSRLWGLALGDEAVDFSTLALLARSAAGYGADALAVGSFAAGDRRGLDPARVDIAQTFSPHALAPALVGTDHDTDPLRRLYQEALPRDEVLLREFLRYGRDGGDGLRDQACHALLRRRYGTVTRDWPRSFAEAHADALAVFARDHAEDIGFEIFLQWLASRGRRAAQAAARAAGMTIGLIADLDWGAAADGVEVWSDPQQHLTALRVADPLHPDGIEASVETVVAPHPLQMAEHGYQAWIALLRANMAGAGSLRLRRFDRWQRVWLQLPDGAASGGAYVEQPFEDLLRLLVLESVRQRCIVIVDDAAALPEKLRLAVEQAGLLRSDSFLQRGAGQRWSANTGWPSCGVACSSSAATPSLPAWWQGSDIRQRIDNGQLGSAVASRELSLRDEDRTRLLAQLGIDRRRRPREWTDGQRGPLRAAPMRATVADSDPLEEKLIDAVIGALGSTPAALVLVSLRDLVSESAESTVDIHNAAHLLDASAVRSRLGRVDDARRGDVAAHVPPGSPGVLSPR